MSIATDPLSLAFIGCFLFGLLFLIASLLLGVMGDFGHGIFDHVHTAAGPSHGIHHPSATHVEHINTHSHAGHSAGHTSGHEMREGHFSIFSIVNPASVVFFLLGFGLFGYIFHNGYGATLPIALALAIVCGAILAGLLVLLINRIIGLGRTHTEQDVSDRIGLVGKVILTIQEKSIGEVLYESPGGLRKSIPARSFDGRRIERGQEVVIINYNGGVAEVDTWDHFIQQDEVDASPASAIDDASLEDLRAFLAEADKNNHEYVIRKEQQKEQ